MELFNTLVVYVNRYVEGTGLEEAVHLREEQLKAKGASKQQKGNARFEDSKLVGSCVLTVSVSLMCCASHFYLLVLPHTTILPKLHFCSLTCRSMLTPTMLVSLPFAQHAFCAFEAEALMTRHEVRHVAWAMCRVCHVCTGRGAACAT